MAGIAWTAAFAAFNTELRFGEGSASVAAAKRGPCDGGGLAVGAGSVAVTGVRALCQAHRIP